MLNSSNIALRHLYLHTCCCFFRKDFFILENNLCNGMAEKFIHNHALLEYLQSTNTLTKSENIYKDSYINSFIESGGGGGGGGGVFGGGGGGDRSKT